MHRTYSNVASCNAQASNDIYDITYIPPSECISMSSGLFSSIGSYIYQCVSSYNYKPTKVKSVHPHSSIMQSCHEWATDYVFLTIPRNFVRNIAIASWSSLPKTALALQFLVLQWTMAALKVFTLVWMEKSSSSECFISLYTYVEFVTCIYVWMWVIPH